MNPHPLSDKNHNNRIIIFPIVMNCRRCLVTVSVHYLFSIAKIFPLSCRNKYLANSLCTIINSTVVTGTGLQI